MIFKAHRSARMMKTTMGGATTVLRDTEVAGGTGLISILILIVTAIVFTVEAGTLYVHIPTTTVSTTAATDRTCTIIIAITNIQR